MRANKQDKIKIAAYILLANLIVFIVGGLNDSNDETVAKNATVKSQSAYSKVEVVKNLEVKNSYLGVDAVSLGRSLTSAIENETSKAEVENADEEVVTAAAVPLAEPYQYENTFIVNVTEYLNVRSTPSADGEIIGKIYRGGGGTVISSADGWSQIVSGTVTGYINNEFAYFSHDAEAHFAEFCNQVAISNADTLRIRKGPGTEYDVLAVVNTGTEINVISSENGWTKVNYIGTEAYVATEFLNISYNIKTGITIAEELEAIKAEEQKKAEEAAAAAKAEADNKAAIEKSIKNSKLVETVQTSAYSVSEQDAYLLACVVSSEAGYESYEGKLAVANIILNRLNGGAYGSTIYDVVYAKGQFSVVHNGALDRAMQKGPNAESLQAAKDALGGKNNVPQYTNFCSIEAANYNSYSGYSIICNQVFYRK